jgi:5-methylcytosine-specific restriction endonuclease McrA
MLKTLVLNTATVPISLTPYRRVLNRIANNSAIVIASYEGTCIRSSGFQAAGFSSGFDRTLDKAIIEMPIPSVIQCVDQNYTPKFTNVLPFNRLNVYVRDKGHCMYCGKKVSLNSFSFDHYIPKSRGGKTIWTNILLCCLKCNSKKGDKPASKFREPLRMPYAPKLDKAAPVQIVNRVIAEIPHKTWTDYLYWRVLLEP